ncbi:transposase [Mangrovicoccus sp. HB161399]|uniref:transposase n=1 Tax=Mangrovicoccus sp. HB161399 TaxID=2720392 RepID=UPI001552D719|nr:transposase [Mangrovicoccus sp. HB161399]
MRKDVSIIGMDLAKQVFELHGSTETGEAVFRRKLSRRQFGEFMKAQPRCRVALEACGTAHHRAGLLSALGHDVCLISPKSVKPSVKTRSEAASGTVRGTVPDAGRHGRCRGDCRSGEPTGHEVRRDQDARTAGAWHDLQAGRHVGRAATPDDR